MHARPYGPTHLSQQQHTFLAGFVSNASRRTRLVARPGTGKATMAAFAAKSCFLSGAIKSTLVLTDQPALKTHWEQLFDQIEMPNYSGTGLATTSAMLLEEFKEASAQPAFHNTFSNKGCLIVLDEPHRSADAPWTAINRMLNSNAQSRFLLLASSPEQLSGIAADILFDSEYFFDVGVLQEDGRLGLEIARFSPTQTILDSLHLKKLDLDDLSWRQFEMLVEELLTARGYEVQLMRGTKDGGVDVIASLNEGPLGLFKTLWQAKKNRRGRKVGLATVRELADTRVELGASKAFIITSSYLTRGAVERIQRDQFILGKVDRMELDGWINDVLLQRHGPHVGFSTIS